MAPAYCTLSFRGIPSPCDHRLKFNYADIREERQPINEPNYGLTPLFDIAEAVACITEGDPDIESERASDGILG
jgi:hypothetical protein